jgi:nucleotide-binding universal stress UspA family protein
MSIFPTRILLATDGSEPANRASRAAIELADKTGSELHVVHAGPNVPVTLAHSSADAERVRQQSRDLLGRQLDQLRDQTETRVEAHLRLGVPAPCIIEVAEEIEAGLIIMGSRGLGGIKRALMGSVADSVTCHAHCAVMVVRGEDKDR